MPPQEGDEPARVTAEAVARRSYGKLISFLAARTRDVAGAEDALSDAFASALAGWPASGIPANPEAWLLTAARRKLIDAVRRRRTAEAGAIELQWLADEIDAASASGAAMPDDRLRRMSVWSHPAIDLGCEADVLLLRASDRDASG